MRTSIRIFDRTKWGTALKPLHELRKEFGSQLCVKYGIYAASRMLRHAAMAITRAHCLDTKKRVTVGMRHLLREGEKMSI